VALPEVPQETASLCEGVLGLITQDELCIVKLEELIVGLVTQPELSLAVTSQDHLEHLPDAEIVLRVVNKTSKVGGLWLPAAW
jgi:hypothetical protein